MVVPIGKRNTWRHDPGTSTLISAYTHMSLNRVDARRSGFPVCLFNILLRGIRWPFALVTVGRGVFARPFNAGRFSHKSGDPRHICFEFAGLKVRALPCGGNEEYWPQYQYQIYAEHQQGKNRWVRREHLVGEGRDKHARWPENQQPSLSLRIEPSLGDSRPASYSTTIPATR